MKLFPLYGTGDDTCARQGFPQEEKREETLARALRKTTIGTQIDPLLHRKLKLVSAASGRRIDAIVEDALRQALAAFPTESFVTFEEMHARYEKLHGVSIDIAAEAARLARRRTK